MHMSLSNARGWVGLAVLFAMLSSPCLTVDAICNPFKRSDTNADGDVDISDAVKTLFFLFIEGASEPPCVEAADSNGDGRVDLSDAVFTLQFLFLEGDPPPSPGSTECGRSQIGSAELTCFDYPPCGVRLEEVDFSGFRQFDFQLFGALGFCAEIGDLFSASIREQAGAMTVALAVLAEGEAGDPDCIPGFFGDEQCAIPEELPSRQLSEEEAAALTVLFKDLGVFRAPDPICQCIAIDPCLIRQFSWDDDSFSDFTCSQQRLEEGLGDDIVQFLERLR